jgi:hypothetical protein
VPQQHQPARALRLGDLDGAALIGGWLVGG